jgi:two-component system, NarL family, response regulator LiaR
VTRLDPAPTGRDANRHATGGRSARPIRVCLVNDYEIVLQGLHSMLRPFSDRIEVVEHQVGGTPDVRADLALFDTFAGRRDAIDRAARMAAEDVVEYVVLYTWDAAGPLLELAASVGVSAVIQKSVTSERLVDLLERVASGERLGLEHAVRGVRRARSPELSEREQEVLALLGHGFTNRQIADQLFLSVDTVKTYTRRVYTKLGVNNRTRAALQAAELGLVPNQHATWVNPP